MKTNLSKRVKAGIIVGAMALSVLGAYSAFTATTQTSVNTFNIVAGEDGQEAGEVAEPDWDEEKAKNLQPGETVPKNPKVVSSVDYESWVFMTVEIPTFHAALNDADGVYDTVVPNFNADGKWTLVKSEKSDTAGTDSRYTYGYNDKVAGRGETSFLFTQFTVPDFTKTEAISDSIDVTGKMIQTEGNDTLMEAAAALGLK